MTPVATPGIDETRFARWTADHLPEIGPVTGVGLLVGGHSNLSYRVDTPAARYVLRRPPLGHVMATAHDMARESRVQTALAATPVPVPAVLHVQPEPDPATGVDAPWYLMTFVEGIPFTDAGANSHLGTGGARILSSELIRVLADLHSVDPGAVGLEGFGRPEGFLARQVRRWTKQLEASRSRPLPQLEALAIAVAEAVPDTGAASVLHGDFKLNNTLVRVGDGGPSIAALLDWEMSTIGDPLTDLAALGTYWRMPEIHPLTAAHFATPVSSAAGYPEFDELAGEYFEARKIAVPASLPWHFALAAFKIAVIVESLHYRARTGKAVGDGFEHVGEMTEPLAAEGLRRLGGAE